MSRPAWLATALLASSLAMVLLLELGSSGPAMEGTGAAPHPAPLARARAITEDPVDHTDAWVQAILARPLFSRDRRPTPVATRSGGETVIASLPRLTGVLVGPFGGRAMFAGESGGKPLAVAEGGTIGRYTVRAIAPGRVTIAGPEGVQQLQPSFDATVRHAMAEAPPQLQAQPVPSAAPGSQLLIQQQLLQQQMRAQGLANRPLIAPARAPQPVPQPAQQGDDTQ